MLQHRGLGLSIKVLAGAVLVIAGTVSWLTWRLANDHPIHLGFLVPALERSLATADERIRFEVDDIVLAWKSDHATPGLWVVGLRGYGKDGHLLGEIDELGLHISLDALAHGMFAPTSIEVLAPAINLRRDADGRFEILGAGDRSSTADSGPIEPGVIDRLLAPPDPNRITGYLREVKLTAGSLLFDDRATGRIWHAPEIDLDMIRDTGGITGRLSAQLRDLGNPATVSVGMDLRSGSRKLELRVALYDVEVPSVARLDPMLANLAGLRLKIDGQVETFVAEDGSLGDLHFTIEGGSGSLDLPETLAAPLKIAKLSLDGELQAGFGSMTIDSAAIELGSTKIEARAQVSGLRPSGGGSDQLRAKGEIGVRNLAVSDVLRLWPLSGGQSSGARDWFAGQIDRGVIGHAQASLDLAWGGPAAPRILGFKGSFDASGVRVNYRKTLPPIENVSLAAHFDTSSLVINVLSGAVGQLSIERGQVTITGLDGAQQSVDLDGDISGPLRDALVLLDAPGLGYLHGTGIKPEQSGGRLSARMRVRFPLAQDVPLAGIDASMKLHIEGASVANILVGQSLSNGNFDADFGTKGIVATGRAAVGGVPFELRWEEKFAGEAPRTQISVQARPDSKDLARFGLNLRGMIAGPIPCEIDYSRFARGGAELGVYADLTPSTLALDFARWRKVAGVPGKANVTLELAGMRPIGISAFSLDAGDAGAEGRGRFGEDGQLEQVAFDRLYLGKTMLDQVVVNIGKSRINAAIGGGELDVEPYLERAESTGIGNDANGAVTSAGSSSGGTLTLALSPSHLDRVLFGAGREIDSLQFSFVHDNAFFLSAEAKGTLLGGGSFSLGWLPGDASTHHLTLTASDAGAALRALGIFDGAAGGRLNLAGTSDDSAPGRPLRGHLEVSEYRLLRQSALLRLFTIATLTGITDMMGGSGMQMRRFVADFTRTKGRVDVRLARTYGPSLGLTAEGYFDVDTDGIDIRGTVVPASALNRFIGKIPLVGFLLKGGQSGGIGSFTYAATGKLSQPGFSVNPLSTLDPGFLKAIFDLPGGGGNPSDAFPPGTSAP